PSDVLVDVLGVELQHADVRRLLLAEFSCFFFSSRRRHTRFSRDWSSDVCSSDLGCGSAKRASLVTRRWRSACSPTCRRPRRARRSEERRVGKECRARWWRGREKKNKRSTDKRDCARYTAYLLVFV